MVGFDAQLAPTTPLHNLAVINESSPSDLAKGGGGKRGGARGRGKGRGGQGGGALLGANAVAQHGEGLDKWVGARCPDEVYSGLSREQKSWLAITRKAKRAKPADISSVAASVAKLTSTVSALAGRFEEADADDDDVNSFPPRGANTRPL